MKIVVCGSMQFCKEMVAAKTELESLGFSVLLPTDSEKFAQENRDDNESKESIKNKICNERKNRKSKRNDDCR